MNRARARPAVSVPPRPTSADTFGASRPRVCQNSKSPGFGGSLYLPRCREADIERSDKPIFALSRSGVRFDTLWASFSRSATLAGLLTIGVRPRGAPTEVHHSDQDRLPTRGIFATV